MTIDEIIKHYEQVLKELKAYKEQSGDCISRQAAISAIMGEYPDAHYPSYYKSKIDELPSIAPQPKMGRWIDDEFGSKCSCCGIYTHLDKFDRPMKFKCCSMCGAKMEVKE